MSSRAALLLQRELYYLSKIPGLWGIECKCVQNNLFHWEATLHGLINTPWEGGVFKLELLFDENFNDSPPEVFFFTVPFHPNIDIETGRPCIDVLDRKRAWGQNLTINGLLIYLQFLLANPNSENPVNNHALDVFNQSPRLYNQLVRDCVIASRRIASGLPPYSEEVTTKPCEDGKNFMFTPFPQIQKQDQHEQTVIEVQKLSFDDYYKSWKALATSMPLSAKLKCKRKI
ncbi:Ubiquitin-conjugating enzyme E2 U [Nowakowskiella sp. JEL0078]|nr:Ubiquitin-conjugating enzyme E2 U [Nowakowskiella sp. JEL0078]